MIEALAWFYVNVLENLGRVLFWLAIAVVIIAFINFLRDPKAKANLVNNLAKMIVQLAKGILVYSGKVLHISFKVLLNSIKVIFAAVRDFWTSKI